MAVTEVFVVGKVIEKVIERFTGEPVANMLFNKFAEKHRTQQHFVNHDIMRSVCSSYYKALTRITEDLLVAVKTNQNEYRYQPELPGMLEENLKRIHRLAKSNETDPEPQFPFDSLEELSVFIKPGSEREVEQKVIKSMAKLPPGLKIDSPVYEQEIEKKCFDYMVRFFAGEIKDNQRVANKLLTEFSVDQMISSEKIIEICSGMYGDFQEQFASLHEKLDRLLGRQAPKDDSWSLINEEILNAPASKSLRKAYYEGHPLSWNLVKSGYTAKRKVTAAILSYLDTDFFQAVLITGAGGEGKTTAMYQVALDLYHKGYKIYLFNKDTMKNNQTSLSFDPKEPSVFLIDDASEIANLSVFFRHFKHFPVPVKIILTARKNEWVSANTLKSLSSEYLKYLEPFMLFKIDQDEADDIARLLIENEAAAIGGSVPEIANKLRNDTNGFLLAAMLTATKGKNLEKIVYTVVQKISTFERGQELLNALAIVALLETIGSKRKKVLTCSIDLFVKVLNVKKEELRKYTSPLTGEVLFQTFGKEITTRHESIAAIIYSILFDENNEYYDQFYIDEGHIYELLLYAAGDLSKENKPAEAQLLSILPKYLYEEKGHDIGIQHYEMALNQNPLRFQTWMDYIKVQQKEGNLGDVSTPGSAVYLCFNVCTHYFQKKESVWSLWLSMERKRGNIGSVDEPYSAAWIAKEGALANPSSGQLWYLWARFEQMNGNIGTIQTENSARWICYTHLQAYKNNSQEVFSLWLQLERRANNIGKASEPYSARWIANQMTSSKGSGEAWLVWHDIECEQENIGDIETKYSARWVLKQGIEQGEKKNPSLWSAWAKLEQKMGNVGHPEAEHTARWVFDQGTRAIPNSSLWQEWIQMELNLENIGSLSTPYSARAIAKRATELNPKFHGNWISRAEIEVSMGNIGTVQETGSARGILLEAITSETNLESIYVFWAELEKQQKNAGSVRELYTARWILSKALDHSQHHSVWLAWADLEDEVHHIGSIEETYSARWLFHQGAVKNGYKIIASRWAELEYRHNNSGSLDEAYTGRWILWKGINEDVENTGNWHRFIFLEYKKGNIGSVSEPGSAMWIYDQFMKKTLVAASSISYIEEVNRVLNAVREKYAASK